MSGIECVGAILGVAGTGIEIASKIYDFSTTAVNAKEDMRTVAESIDTFSSVLETLGRQLETSEAVVSKEGIALARELEHQCTTLFQKIAEHIPSATDEVSVRQKLTWYFQKDRVAYLLSQVEQLKATVSLLLQILILAQTSKPKTGANVTNHNVTNNVNINVNVINADINSQFRRAENRVLQYHDASVRFARLQIQEAEPVVRNALPWQEEFEELPVVRQTNTDDDFVATFDQLALRQPRNTNANSAQLVNMLLDHWTIVDAQVETTTTSSTTFEVEEELPMQSQPKSDSEPSTKTSQANLELKNDPLSKANTASDDPQRTALALNNTASSTGSKNTFTGWWHRYRDSQRTTREEDERKRQLEKQENELKRRETQVQREQALLDRELKLREAEKQKSEAQARALAEREKQIVEIQKLKEAEHKQALAEKEMRAQAELRQKEARKEHLARLRDIRRPGTSEVTQSVPRSHSQRHRDLKLPLSRDTESIQRSGSLSDVSTVGQSADITSVSSVIGAQVRPARSTTDGSMVSSESSITSPYTGSLSPIGSPPLDKVSHTLQSVKAARKQRREEWKQKRKAAKKSKSEDSSSAFS